MNTLSTTGRTRAPLWLLLAIALLVLVACDDDDGGLSSDEQTAVVDGADATFTSGVASGDVTSTSAVFWTRAEGGDFLKLEVARDEAFVKLWGSFRVGTSAAKDFTVKLKLMSFDAEARYFYRFVAGDTVSPTGTFVTPPNDDERPSQPLRFVFSGDSDGSRAADGTPPYNEFGVLDTATAEDPAFFLYFGDTIYADRTPIATTLDGYRAKYRENRGYAALANILARTPTFNMWDDHEVVNDFAGTTVDPAMLRDGRRAFREYMPISGDDANGYDAVDENDEQMYRAFRWGADIDLIILDERTYRDGSAADACTADSAGQPDPIPGLADPAAPEDVRVLREFVGLDATLPPECLATINDASRTMLGEAQMEFLRERLSSSDATWKIIVNSVPVQSLLALPYDRWEGYAAERRAMLEFIRDERISNVVFLTTDFHANIFGPVRIDPFSDDPAVAYEAVAGPIATAPLRVDIADVLGEAAAGVLDSFFTGVAKVDCAQLNSYAYGLVEVSEDGRTLTITAKDQSGAELCRKELIAT